MRDLNRAPGDERAGEVEQRKVGIRPLLSAHEQSERGHAYRIADDGVYVYLVRNPDSDEAPALASTARPAEADGGGSESRPPCMVDPWEDGAWGESEPLRLLDPWEDGEPEEAKPLRIVAHG